jgi:hypothetical protein
MEVSGQIHAPVVLSPGEGAPSTYWMGQIPNLIEIYLMTTGHSHREAETLFALLWNMQMVDITAISGVNPVCRSIYRNNITISEMLLCGFYNFALLSDILRCV